MAMNTPREVRGVPPDCLIWWMSETASLAVPGVALP
jgi:hypothetical protein